MRRYIVSGAPPFLFFESLFLWLTTMVSLELTSAHVEQ